MRLSLVARLFTSTIVQAKKPKSDRIVVRCKSLVSGYQIHKIRPRLDDKLEFLCWDPLVQQDVLYKEGKKLRSVPPHPNGKSVELYSINANKPHRENNYCHNYYPEDNKPRIKYPRRQVHMETNR